LIEKLSQHELSGVLLISLCRTSSFIDGLFKTIISDDGTHTQAQKLACSSILRELLIKSGEKMFTEQTDFVRQVPNMLSSIHEKVHEYAKSYAGQLASVLVQLEAKRWDLSPITFSSFTVKRPLGLYTFGLLEILSDLVSCVPSTIASLPPQIFRVLGNWFLEFRHNNLYHVLFFKIFRAIAMENQDDSMKTLFSKYKFLTKIIEHYVSDEPSGCRGFIIVICNTIRLAADLQENDGWIRRFLLSHDQWKQFLPQLRMDTQAQLQRYTDLTLDDDEINEGIDLGSPYAHSLGFSEINISLQDSSNVAKKKKKKKKKGRKYPDDGDCDLTSSETASSCPSDLHTTIAQQENQTKSSLQGLSQFNLPMPQQSMQGLPKWWQVLKQDLENEENQEENLAKLSLDWWVDMKEELKLSLHTQRTTID